MTNFRKENDGPLKFRMKKVIAIVLAAIVVIGGGFVGLQWYKSWDAAFSEKPTRSASTLAFDVRKSTIQPSISLPYDVIANTANQAVDKFAVPMGGRVHVDCREIAIDLRFTKLVLYSGCLDVDWSLSAARNGTISVSKVGDGIAVNIPVKFNGNAGPNGDIARLLSFNNKAFSGAFVASAQGKITLDGEFCPKILNPSAEFRWTTSASIEVIGRNCAGVGRGFELCLGPWNLPVGDLMTPTIKSKLQDQVNDINSKIPCDPVRKELVEVWKNYSFPVSAEGVPPMFVNIKPVALSVPGVIAEDSNARLVARLDADVVLSTQKGAEGSAGTLPTNQPLASTAGKLSVAIPLTADYETLSKIATEQVAKQIAQRPLSVDTPVGPITIKPSNVEIYPSGDKVAVGIKFDADIPGRVFDANGTIWLTAHLETTPNGRGLHFSEVTLTRKIDNELWASAASILSDLLPKILAEKSIIDFGPKIDEAVKKAQSILSDPKQTKDVVLTVRNIDVKLGRITPTEKVLVVEGLLDADVDASLEKLPL
jgi:hypothetical protein